MSDDPKFPSSEFEVRSQPHAVAVIDVGTTSLRMDVAEIHRDGRIRKLASYSQAVSLGHDAFRFRKLGKRTIEDCVHVLQTYRQQLNELGISDTDRIRVIATSAVAESSNQLAMIDRIFVATGFEVELIDDAELHRVTYLGVLPYIVAHPKLFSRSSVVCEVGGGAIEFLMLNKSDVQISKSLRHGSLRLRQALESVDAPANRSREILETGISKVVREIQRLIGDDLKEGEIESYVTLGGDVRFVALQVKHKQIDDRLIRVEARAIEKFVTEILELSNDQIANKFHISIPDAASLAPSLLTHLAIFRALGAKKFLIAEANVRDGMITEMAHGRRWSDSIHTQIVRSAEHLGKKYHFRKDHARQVAKLACQLFDCLGLIHQLEQRYRGILEIAAIVHEIGLCVATRSYHKHSMYLIRHSELFGIGKQELELVALVARYHRRATPQPSHDGYARLARLDRVAVAKLAAILRVAISLNQSGRRQISSLEARIEGDRVIVTCHGMNDVSIERADIKRSGSFFEEIFGKQIVLAAAGEDTGFHTGING